VEEFIANYHEYLCDAGGPPPRLSIADEVLLFLVWLRHHPVDVLLGFIFGIHQGTARRCRLRMLDWFYGHLKDKISFGTLRKEKLIVKT
jgi:hypothetical protein